METAVQSITKNPAITAAIRAIKDELKTLAVSQKTGKKEFRAAQRAWTGARSAPTFADKSEHITSLHIIYNRLRETKRPHLDEQKYFEAVGIGYRRRHAMTQAMSWLKTTHPESAAKLEVK